MLHYAHMTEQLEVPIDRLVGSGTACLHYGIDRSTLIRRIQAGSIVPLKRLDGRGSWVFDERDLPSLPSSTASIEALREGKAAA